MFTFPASHNPSWKQGFARRKSEAQYPSLWKNLESAWLPSLGPTGTILRDIVRGNDGVFTGKDVANDWVKTGERFLPWSINFADTGDIVDITDITVTPEEGNSWGFWWNGVTADVYPMSRIGGTPPVNSYVNILTTSAFRWRDRSGNFYSWSPAPNMIDGEWHFICGTQDINNTRLYVDGVEVSSAKATVGGTTSDWEIFGRGAGEISNMFICRRMLQPNEILLLFNDPSAIGRFRQTSAFEGLLVLSSLTMESSSSSSSISTSSSSSSSVSTSSSSSSPNVDVYPDGKVITRTGPVSSSVSFPTAMAGI
jgi:hypothetical protein